MSMGSLNSRLSKNYVKLVNKVKGLLVILPSEKYVAIGGHIHVRVHWYWPAINVQLSWAPSSVLWKLDIELSCHHRTIWLQNNNNIISTTFMPAELILTIIALVSWGDVRNIVMTMVRGHCADQGQE